jgi:hypothetical protein
LLHPVVPGIHLKEVKNWMEEIVYLFTPFLFFKQMK